MSSKKRCRRTRKIEQEWTPNDVRLLIRLVAQRDLLWDPSNSSHKDGKLREEAFRIIASKLDRTLADCKAKWDNLRAQYRSYQAKATQNVKIKWQYFEPLHFLHQVCEPRKSKGNSVSHINIYTHIYSYTLYELNLSYSSSRMMRLLSSVHLQCI